ncbi:MAG: hypothetical protein AABY83_15475 [Pseudomonadota bacterium]
MTLGRVFFYLHCYLVTIAAGDYAWRQLQPTPYLTPTAIKTAIIEYFHHWDTDATPSNPPLTTSPLWTALWQGLQTLPQLATLTQQRQMQIDAAVKSASQ